MGCGYRVLQGAVNCDLGIRGPQQSNFGPDVLRHEVLQAWPRNQGGVSRVGEQVVGCQAAVGQ